MASSGTYDAIVVGGGFSGLATAALLARTGRSVLVAERSEAPGGYGKPFRRGPYLFDPAVHTCPEVEYIKNFLAYLEVGDMVELVDTDAPFRVVYPDFTLTFPHGQPALSEVLQHEFPDAADEIRDFLALRDAVFDEAARVPHVLGLDKLDAAAKAFPTLFGYRTATMGAVLEERVSNPRVRALLSSMWPYQGTSPDRVGFILACQYLGAFILGSHYAKGSFGTCVDALVTALERDGGEVLVHAPVVKILVQDGAARGVRLEDGTELIAPLVVSNVDATATWERLVGLDLLPKAYRRRLERLKPSLSAAVLFAATDLPLDQLGATHETFIYEHWDHADNYQDILDFKPGGLWMSVPTLVDPSLAPAGEFVVILTSLAVYDDQWLGRKAAFREQMIDVVEGQFPGFRDHLKFAELATPPTFEHYSGNRNGAIYGWEQSSRQTGSKRLGHVTPIDGLMLTGHWTHEGAGFIRQLVGADETVNHVLAAAGDQPLPSFRPDYMPRLASFDPT